MSRAARGVRRQLRHLLARVAERERVWRNHNRIAARRAQPGPPALGPVWPLPRSPHGPTDAEVLARAGRHPFWFHPFEFDGGLRLPERPEAIGRRGGASAARALQRFRHFMPWLLAETGGDLRGRRVLDIACNAGFWSIQCALLGAAEVLGFDTRPDMIEQANLVKAIAGVERVTFRLLDFWQMDRETLGGPFDVVLNLGLLYHLPEPLAALERTREMAREYILLDTALHVARAPLLLLRWEEPEDIASAARPGIVTHPTKRAVELMLRHVGLTDFLEVPLRSADLPPTYLRDKRASWLIRVPGARGS